MSSFTLVWQKKVRVHKLFFADHGSMRNYFWEKYHMRTSAHGDSTKLFGFINVTS